jgi:hypothetical protein
MTVPLCLSLAIPFSLPLQPSLQALAMHSVLQFMLSSQFRPSSSSSLSPSLLLLYLAAAGQQEGGRAGVLLSAAVFQLIIGCTQSGK